MVLYDLFLDESGRKIMNVVKGYIGLSLVVLLHAAEESPVFPMHEALKGKKYDQALEALLLVTDVDSPDDSGNTPLCLASKNGNADAYDMVIALLRRGADPNISDNKGYMPLHYAAKSGNLAVVEALIRFGARINPEYRHPETGEGKPGWTPLYLARMKNRKRVADFLVIMGGKIHSSQKQDLDYRQRVNELLEQMKSYDISEEDYSNMTNAEKLAYAYDQTLSASIQAGKEIGIDPDKILYLEALKHQIESRISNGKPPNISESEWIEQIHMESDIAAIKSTK